MARYKQQETHRLLQKGGETAAHCLQSSIHGTRSAQYATPQWRTWKTGLFTASLDGDAGRRLQFVVVMCRLLHKEYDMATNLALDPLLLDRVVAVSGESTKKAAVTLALKEFIARREQRRVAELFGKLEWDSTYDYKAERSRP